MIKKESILINGITFIHQISDSGKMLYRDGIYYDDVYDPADMHREYIEADCPETATTTDYEAALNKLGVET